MICNCSNNIDNSILYISTNEYNFFLNKPNVVGVGLGYKITNGFYTNDKCITVFVTNKVPLCNLSTTSIVPTCYKGFKTDIVVSGQVFPCSLTDRIRPAKGGYSISPSLSNISSTLGCLVNDGNYKYVLGTNHSLTGEEAYPLGTPITQPGIGDMGIVSRDTIANLSKFIKLKYETPTQTPENYVDCAICKISGETLVSSDIAFVGTPRDIAAPKLKLSVQKIGRTSSHTFGRITNLGVTIEMNYKKGKAIFVNQIGTTAMASQGDSGALLLSSKLAAFGLLISTSPSVTFYSPIPEVLDYLGVHLITR